MALTPGSRVGAYEIAELIGSGGMGEVFRAVDRNLNRVVAIKVLPASLAHDADRLARFEREAQTLAALNHPNIAQVYGFERVDGVERALVMEFVEGPTLADRIGGMPMPIDDVLAIAAQIADALESAHDHGIIHRDLKPLNIKVRPDGTVKVLDFGLAKAVGGTDSASAASAHSPTITTPAMTHAGVVLGTAAYMSPEQAKGRVVDRRADIWAFGCVLFEMLTGRRAFVGDDVSDVMVSILRDEPAWDLLPAATPSLVRSLLRRCLQKDPRKRLPHIGLARLELTDPPDTTGSSTSRVRSWMIPAAVAAIVLAIGVTASIVWPGTAKVDGTKLRVKIELGANTPITLTGTIAISADGSMIAFVGRSAANATAPSLLFVRRLDELAAVQLDGTEGATGPFFSPDGNSIGFFDFANNQLKRVSVTGGRATVICEASGARGGWWGDDDVIVFAAAHGLQEVNASGGALHTIVPVGQGGRTPFWPQVLPGGKHLIYSEALGSDQNTGVVMARRLTDGSTTELVQGRFARYVSSGVLTYFRSGTLYAVAFDPVTLQRQGDPEAILDDAAVAALGSTPMVAVSASGTLVYMQGTSTGGAPAPIMWLAQKGPLTPLRAAPASWLFPRFSPDGNRIAMSIHDGRQTDIWVYDYTRDVMTRVTSDPALDLAPVWTPDGRGLVFGSARDSATALLNLYWQRADGTGAARRLTAATIAQLPGGFDPAGRRLILHQGDPATARMSIAVLDVEPEGEGLKAGRVTELIGGPFLKSQPRISPDGRWIAYVANDSGTYELFVQPFSAGAARVQVSNGGAYTPIWSPVKNELFYTGPAGLMVAPFTTTNEIFVPAKPRTWTDTPFSASPPVPTFGPAVDLHPDGARFAVAPPNASAPTVARGGQLVLMLNAFTSRVP